MQFVRRQRKLIGNPNTELYGHCLQFYGQPPLENISLTEFETFAVDRLKLLKTVENLGDDQKPEVGPADYEKRRKDHLSHFILRLAYCQTEDLRRWFIQQEVDLFRYRFNCLSSQNKKIFLQHNNLHYDMVSVEEKKALSTKLINSSFNISACKVEDQDFYKVPFQDTLELVRTRKVYLKAGYAYIPHQDIVTIRWRHAYVGQDYSIQKSVGKISLEQIDMLSEKSFPLCMRQLHHSLRENHHLRHGGRMQCETDGQQLKPPPLPLPPPPCLTSAQDRAALR
ncbi:hypothetical protein NHX12_022819 [Muraenolepis orangiensis]|uniref:DNA primase large subunit C-terminal domain-containing protein n=1 Tax=Muraenolepis orangiensis TaxID=630683 RepID=A0A9Q0ES84_9TELE|nr:hypothetical protein NHX12_022819 [Muraenolepis orangiensis]